LSVNRGRIILVETSKVNTLFLDRDGVINKKLEGKYVRDWNEFTFMPNALKAISRLSKIFNLIIIVTNQQGIAKGIMTEDDLIILHQKMIKEIEKNGGKINKVYICPHFEQDDCNCRKPKTGMIESAIKDFPYINRINSYLVGDSNSDIEAGNKAGLKTIKVDNSFTLYDWTQKFIKD